MSRIKVTYSSPPDREFLVADLFIDNYQFAEIRYENGSFDLLTYLPEGEYWELPVEDLIPKLEEAKESLKSRLPKFHEEESPFSTGLKVKDWHLLKHVVLKTSRLEPKGNYELFDDLPDHLRASEIGNLIYESVYLGHKKAANKAASLLTGGSDSPWLILEKS
jgi:hypothetical protein